MFYFSRILGHPGYRTGYCCIENLWQELMGEKYILNRNSTVARRVTNDTSEHYGNP